MESETVFVSLDGVHQLSPFHVRRHVHYELLSQYSNIVRFQFLFKTSKPLLVTPNNITNAIINLRSFRALEDIEVLEVTKQSIIININFTLEKRRKTLASRPGLLAKRFDKFLSISNCYPIVMVFSKPASDAIERLGTILYWVVHTTHLQAPSCIDQIHRLKSTFVILNILQLSTNVTVFCYTQYSATLNKCNSSYFH